MNNLTILAMIKDGIPVKQIAAHHGVKKKAIDYRLKLLRRKHNCSTTVQLIVKVELKQIEV
jgi:DNA-binding CsgD family transcriptional regulator